MTFKLSATQKTILVFIAIFCVTILIVSAVASVLGTAHNTGTIPSVNSGVFKVSGNTLAVSGSTIAWGTLAFGANINTASIQNTGNAVRTFTITAGVLPAGVTFSCDFNNQVVAAGATKTGTITLNVAEGTAPQDIAFDITWSFT
jgi:hypothetical protein